MDKPSIHFSLFDKSKKTFIIKQFITIKRRKYTLFYRKRPPHFCEATLCSLV